MLLGLQVLSHPQMREGEHTLLEWGELTPGQRLQGFVLFLLMEASTIPRNLYYPF